MRPTTDINLREIFGKAASDLTVDATQISALVPATREPNISEGIRAKYFLEIFTSDGRIIHIDTTSLKAKGRWNAHAKLLRRWEKLTKQATGKKCSWIRSLKPFLGRAAFVDLEHISRITRGTKTEEEQHLFRIILCGEQTITSSPFADVKKREEALHETRKRWLPIPRRIEIHEINTHKEEGVPANLTEAAASFLQAEEAGAHILVITSNGRAEDLAKTVLSLGGTASYLQFTRNHITIGNDRLYIRVHTASLQVEIQRGITIMDGSQVTTGENSASLDAIMSELQRQLNISSSAEVTRVNTE
ncbi:hypothetical protein CL629_00095 [bacterium]|nr:hypothetical protein [bacterium]|tara:strand:+ start:1619 stop:2530 length:912 start_codon:yes stop_codon:yes gene_type:complete